MTGTVLNVPNWKREGIAYGARAMLVVWDTFPWPPEPYQVCITPGESIAERFAALDGVGMRCVHAVYLLN
jgi:hypothetical protein